MCICSISSAELTKADCAYQVQCAQNAQDEAERAVRILSSELEEIANSDDSDASGAMSELPAGMTAEYVGEFMCTAYCAEEYPHICGGNGITASGTKPTEGITAAADWDILPAGTIIYIEDVGIRRIEDTGSAIDEQKLDICVTTHEQALSWAGYGYHNVWILGSENDEE